MLALGWSLIFAGAFEFGLVAVWQKLTKSRVNPEEEGLCQFLGALLLGFGLIISGGVLLMAFGEKDWLANPGSGIVLICLGIFLVALFVLLGIQRGVKSQVRRTCVWGMIIGLISTISGIAIIVKAGLYYLLKIYEAS